jgi:hypothetical protein
MRFVRHFPRVSRARRKGNTALHLSAVCVRLHAPRASPERPNLDQSARKRERSSKRTCARKFPFALRTTLYIVHALHGSADEASAVFAASDK